MRIWGRRHVKSWCNRGGGEGSERQMRARSGAIYDNLLLWSLFHGVREPRKSGVHPLPRESVAMPDLPRAVGDGVQAEALGTLLGGERHRQIFLIREEENGNAPRHISMFQLHGTI